MNNQDTYESGLTDGLTIGIHLLERILNQLKATPIKTEDLDVSEVLIMICKEINSVAMFKNLPNMWDHYNTKAALISLLE